jgi:type IV pilus assembly protein PilY1
MFAKEVPYRGTAGTKWDPAAVSGGRYDGPPGGGCGKNHIIFIANGGPGEVTDNDAQALLAALGGDVTPLVYPSSLITTADQGNWSDEYARFLRNVDVLAAKSGVQNITTHTVAVTDGGATEARYRNFMRAIANQGGGQYYAAQNLNELVTALMNIFNSIQAVNSVFASASLPISVNTQGTYKNQVFVGQFRPDQNGLPRWPGNLKQYQMVYDRATDTLQLSDANGTGALNSATGFFRPTAVSYWTRASSFWVNNPMGTPRSTSDLPDGEVVEKGGIAQGLRTTYATDQTARKVYTCIGCSGGNDLASSASYRFEDANGLITIAKLGAADAADRTAMINWMRGLDNRGDELGPGGTTTVRPSIHGDVLHSRPAVVDYGGSIGTVAFYGGNDGMLRAINGNQTGTGAGQEMWAFVAEEHLSTLKRVRNNSPEVRYPSTVIPTATPRDYYMDGPVSVYQRIVGGNTDRVIILASMRRGGRTLYAFDVTNPAQPRIMWKVNNSSVPVLGQTWSEARVAKLKGFANPVVIMGAGYDPAAEDVTPRGATVMGNAVVVLDLANGNLLKTLPTTYSVPAPVTMMDTDFDGYADRAYAADVGGNIYRIDFETGAGVGGSANWVINTFAQLPGSSTNRKFFYEPDVVQTATFVAVLIGSGDREKPLQTVTEDRFFTLFDYNLGKGPTGAAVITNADTVPYGSYNMASSPKGCYLNMDATGEKVVTSSVSTGGYTYFSTNRPTPPDPDTCSGNLGVAKGYRVPLFCGTPQSIEYAGGGLPPSPVSGMVQVTIPTIDGMGTETRNVPFIIGGFNPEQSGLAVSKVKVDVDATRRRTYWYQKPSR